MGTSLSGPTLTLSILKALQYIFITSLLEFYLAVGDLLRIISPVDCGDCGDADSLGGGRSQGRRRHHVSHAVTSEAHTSHQGDTHNQFLVFFQHSNDFSVE